ncbi:MAG: imidazole glycerol phosphate synthase subunit HisH [Bacteroidales bacterium]|nr:imidazole glycerol phosphate synthase subunit HisH [Bacteroidales bacterium]
MNIAIIKYNAGNIRSVDYGLRRLGIEPVLTDDHEMIKKSDKVIFPGVGEAGSTMNYLKERKLDLLIRDLEQPVLGICLGLQLLCAHSEESDTPCIGIFDMPIKRFPATDKVPHMGWNKISKISGKIFPDQVNNQYVYYVHSYYAPVGLYTSAVTDYITPFSAALEKDNFFATQFHPEKSGSIGELILKSFIEL